MKRDSQIFDLIAAERNRQMHGIELIASENFVSDQVMEAMGSVLTNKYAEGYPGARYYGGCEVVDKVETLAIERICRLYGAEYANVQPHSGAQANMAVFFACMQPGDTFMGLDLAHGGHLSHGSPVNMSGKYFKAVGYQLDEATGVIDYDAMERKALECKPKLIVGGASAYSREWDYKRMREIADKVGALLMVDMAHTAGLIAAGLLENPVKYAHIVTSTTHKTLRGPRGGFILTNSDELGPKINKAIFPGAQGGPLMHVIAGKAVAFGEALRPDYRVYMEHVVENCRTLGQGMTDGGLRLVSGGTDNHLCLVDLTASDITGKDAEKLLESVGLTVNKNSIPNEQRSPFVTSGIRVGSAAATTRGFTAEDFYEIGQLIATTVFNATDEAKLADVRAKVDALLEAHPLYPGLEY